MRSPVKCDADRCRRRGITADGSPELWVINIVLATATLLLDLAIAIATDKSDQYRCIFLKNKLAHIISGPLGQSVVTHCHLFL